jgi:hypothetical protein
MPRMPKKILALVSEAVSAERFEVPVRHMVVE